MAINLLSLNKFERTNEKHPNYIANIEFEGIPVECEIYTNARLRFIDFPETYGNSRLIATDFNFAKMNGNLYLKVESINFFEVFDKKQLTKELRNLIIGRI